VRPPRWHQAPNVRGADLADQLVFVTLEGDALDPANLIRRYFKMAVEPAGLSASTRLYDLRHASAALFPASGAACRTRV